MSSFQNYDRNSVAKRDMEHNLFNKVPESFNVKQLSLIYVLIEPGIWKRPRFQQSNQEIRMDEKIVWRETHDEIG